MKISVKKWLSVGIQNLRSSHRSRADLAIGKDTPEGRAVAQKPSETATARSVSRVGGIHHRYVWRDTA